MEMLVAPDAYRLEAMELRKRADELDAKADEVAHRVRAINQEEG